MADEPLLPPKQPNRTFTVVGCAVVDGEPVFSIATITCPTVTAACQSMAGAICDDEGVEEAWVGAVFEGDLDVLQLEGFDEDDEPVLG